jgi:uroporphyrinogen decarboxylase
MAEAWGADVRSFSRDQIAPYIVGPIVERVSAWRQLPELEVAESSLAREIEAVRRVRAELHEDVPLLVPLYSPLMTADVLSNGRIVEDVRTFSSDLRVGLQAIAEGTSRFGRACLDAGADGAILITDMASAARMRRREYRDFGQEFDLAVWNALQSSEIRIHLLQGGQLFFDTVDRFPIHAVCWDTWRSDPSLASAAAQVRLALMGGINPSTFAGGTAQDLEEQIREALDQTGGWRLILAPSGPLAPDARPELLSTASRIVRALTNA